MKPQVGKRLLELALWSLKYYVFFRMYPELRGTSRAYRTRLFYQQDPILVKWGQWWMQLSTGEMREELSKLLDQGADVPSGIMRPIIERRFDAPIAHLFRYFNDRAIGRGAIALVYEGIWGDGTEVVTKVVRPDVEARLADFMRILEGILRFLAFLRIPMAVSLRGAEVPRQFSEWIKQEIDMTHEGDNLDLMRGHCEGTDMEVPRKVFVAKSRRLLVMTAMPGMSLNHPEEKLRKAGLDPQASLRAFAWGTLFSPIVLGLPGPFHGNPSAANLHALPGGRIGLIDLGLVGHATSKEVAAVNDIVFALYRRQSAMVTEHVLALCGHEFRSERRRRRFARDMEAYVQQAASESFGYWLSGLGRILIWNGIPAPKLLVPLGRFAMDLDATMQAFFPDYRASDLLGTLFEMGILRRDAEAAFAGVFSYAGNAGELLQFLASRAPGMVHLLQTELLKLVAGRAPDTMRLLQKLVPWIFGSVRTT